LQKAEKFLEETKNSKLYKIKNSGHFPFLENKKEFLEIFNKIIK
jgi:pimeloyl-ACP methyl ester carboxylesterase